jgi:hypothetical protein
MSAPRYQVIKIPGTGGYAAYRFGGGRSKGLRYTRTAANALRDWLIERDAGYPPRLAMTALDESLGFGDRILKPDCKGPCCRKGPKRAGRVPRG